MKGWPWIVCLILVTACESTDNKISIKQTDTLPVIPTTPGIPIEEPEFTIDTLLVDHKAFPVVLKDDAFYCLLSSTGDTLITPQEYYVNPEFPDINEDGYKDLRVYVASNTDNQCENYLYQKSNGSFRLLDDCDMDIKKIPGAPYYYGYVASGCADQNWMSYIGKIENNKWVVTGYMDAVGCNGKYTEDAQRRIKIYRSKEDEMRLVEEFPYGRYLDGSDEKFDFFEKYWKKNYKRFP
jgi:hypothetical protein